MRTTIIAALAALGICGALGTAATAQEAVVDEVTEAMARLSFLAGRWEGEGWSRMGPGEPVPFRISETIEYKAGGTVMTMEGHGRSTDPETGEEVPTHDALGVVSYDAAGDRYLMRAFTSQGVYADAEVEVGDGTLVWSFSPGGAAQVRYTLTLDDQGRWVEKGEFSPDGESWMEILGMTLTRTDDP